VLGLLAALLVAARLALPSVLREAVNRRLQQIPDYTGQVASVGVSLYRGAYSLHGLEIVQRAGQVKEPFFRARHIDFSLAWRELFRGRMVSDIELEGAELSFVQGPTVDTTQLTADRRWQEVINDLFPIDITHLKITEGRLRYVNTATEPRVDVQVAHLAAVATGLRNRTEDDGEEFPARITLRGETIGGGRLRILTLAEPLAAQPHFLVKLELEAVALPALNDFLRAYGGVDVRAGTFNGYLEMVARNGRFEGYFKPFFQDVDFTDIAGQEKSLGAQVWEGMVRFFAFVFKNHSRDQVATRIPFSGEFGRPEFSAWETFVNVLRHAFVRPWPERLESKTVPAGETSEGGKPPPPTRKPGG
jgi:hypothetical protein